MICERLKEVLPQLIDSCQGDFVAGRLILDNILVCQDMLKGYNNERKPPRCTIKVDLRKAYDFVCWDFIEGMLMALGFPGKFVKWIMQCVRTPSFSLMINGALYGFFAGKKGIRQGDPMSPLLFVLIMEYLTRMLRKICKKKGFTFHQRCEKLALNHLIFADDLMLFCFGNKNFVQFLIRALKTFEKRSGLQVNTDKSVIYFGNVPTQIKDDILMLSGFETGEMPFKYLGIPLNDKYLKVKDYDALIDKMMSKLHYWSTRNLSYSARAVLVNAVLMSLHIYWAQPKFAGGLGIRGCLAWNRAALGSYVWKIAKKTDSLWVKWVHAVYIKDQDWWDYVPKKDAGWGCKLLCKVKDELKDGFMSNNWLNKKYRIADCYRWIQAMLGRLKTRDKLVQFGACANDRCLLCGLHTEIVNHLFFDCIYIYKCLSKICSWINIPVVQYSIDNGWKIWKDGCKIKTRQNVLLAVLTAVIYQIWFAKNHAFWEKAIIHPDRIVQAIKIEVLGRCQQMISSKRSRNDCKWLYSLRLLFLPWLPVFFLEDYRVSRLDRCSGFFGEPYLEGGTLGTRT
ncbi:uncharacterized protein LOC110705884 [Chenopodium quinoa]|uniref:uncharacterized protein LOC110705884 n=1 Tax=Chenopodium quinoa TaxID=63459 RepID=UPI000B78E3E8|nr:uncharacterized protein LOC110705884 [Chenopodium quinoa]